MLQFEQFRAVTFPNPNGSILHQKMTDIEIAANLSNVGELCDGGGFVLEGRWRFRLTRGEARQEQRQPFQAQAGCHVSRRVIRSEAKLVGTRPRPADRPR